MKMDDKTISKAKILNFMSKRMEAIQNQIDRDFGSGLTGRNEAYREVKYWKEAIERGCFDFDSNDK